jgi:probable HAF family extracellular repeat protein
LLVIAAFVVGACVEVLAPPASEAHDINESGVIVGEARPVERLLNSGCSRHAFIKYPGQPLRDLGAFRVAGVSGQPDRHWCNTVAIAVSDANVVAGNATDESQSNSRAFRWEASTGMVDLGTLGGSTASVSDINAAGVIVGASASLVDGVLMDVGFIWEPASRSMRRLPNLPGAVRSLPAAINDHGVIVGKAVMPTGVTKAVRWAAGTREISTLGLDYSSSALDLNNAGAVIGMMRDAPASLEVPVYWAVGDNFTRYAPGGSRYVLGGINDQVILISVVTSSDGRLRPALWNPNGSGGVINVDVPGDAVGTALNEKNQVAGWYLDASSQQRVAAQFQ